MIENRFCDHLADLFVSLCERSGRHGRGFKPAAGLPGQDPVISNFSRMKRLKSALASLLFSLFCLWLSAGATGRAYRHAEMLWAGRTALGRVISRTCINDHNSPSYRRNSHYVSYTFTVSAVEHEGKSLVTSGCYDDCPKGEQITVTYLPSDPSQSDYGGKFYHAGWALWYGAKMSFWGIFGLFGVIFVLTGFKDSAEAEKSTE